MPLRVRLIMLVGLVLLASLACGSALVGWHAVSSVRVELRAALDVGVQTVQNGFDDLAHDDDRSIGLRRLVATFNGNRHVRATLLDANDRPVTASTLLVPSRPSPAWFRRLIGGDPSPERLAVPPAIEHGAAILLQADPTNEVAEVWDETHDAIFILGGFALLSALLLYAAVGHALRPLETLSAAFEQIGQGDYHRRIPQHGPPELVRLARGFNQMTQRLAAAAMQNRRLNERLLTLQAEERADLARDLHDEVGPLLFAVNMTAATIGHLATSDRGADIPAQIRIIHDAVARMQRHVRSILERLRPLRGMGLLAAIDGLMVFWRNCRPGIAFDVTVSVEEDEIGDDLKDTIYRVVQEAVSNAVRHGEPTRVQIAVVHGGNDHIRVEITDDGTGLPADGSAEPGMAQLGLVGMRERVMAMAGSLTIQHGGGRRGLALVARLPRAGSRGAGSRGLQDMEAQE
ncbi:MAG TPA: HAMP domain-containing protein [Acetobacteraceae bacterium]|nr:HAMP domain-containing protein [Acetobacteraceae bacterium]